MDINIEDHLSVDEMKEIARDVFRTKCEDKSKDEIDTLVTNAAYYIVSQMVDDHFDEGLDKKIRDKTIQVINGLTQYTVFHSGDRPYKNATTAHKLMEAAAHENKELIGRRVERAIMSIRKDDIMDAVFDSEFTVKIGAK